MVISVEISMYPFREEYIPPIKAYIEKLNSYQGLSVKTFPTSTVIMGDYDLVMTVIKESIQWSYQQYGKAVFVTKIIPAYEAL